MKTINLKENQIKELSEELSMGAKCFYNFSTGEIKVFYPDESGEFRDFYEEEEALKYEEIMENSELYYEFEPMTSRESFQIMEDFVETLSDIGFANRLVYALSHSKPFSHFNDIIENSKYRQDWFNFRDENQKDWVKKQVNRHNHYASFEDDSDEE